MTWNDEAKKKVRSDLKSLKAKKQNLKGKIEIARYLMRHHPDYKKYSIEHIKRMIREATDPKYNLDLRYPDIASPLLRQVRADYESKGIEWTPELNTEQSELVASIEGAFEDASKAFAK